MFKNVVHSDSEMSILKKAGAVSLDFIKIINRQTYFVNLEEIASRDGWTVLTFRHFIAFNGASLTKYKYFLLIFGSE